MVLLRAFLLVGTLSSIVAYSIDGTAIGPEYDGHGSLSAGASSRLLFDYEEPYRSDILDFLFKPDFGAAQHQIKIEIGGDTQSTDGTEQSHMRSRDDLSCTRGYESWLLKEAKKRNPDIKTWSLSWGVPAWIGNLTYFSDDNLGYQVQWLKCLRDVHNISTDYLGIWNERSQGTAPYVKALRAALDNAGFAQTQLVVEVPQGNNLLAELPSDPELDSAIPIFGQHYPCKSGTPTPLKKFWSSEDSSTEAAYSTGGGCWGRLLNQNYLKLNATATIQWSTIWAVYNGNPYFGNGLMYAQTPWSGNYQVMSPIWANAHWCQFSKIGWKYLLPLEHGSTTSGSGFLSLGGSYVTVIPPAGSPAAFTIVIEKMEGACLRCAGETTQNETAVFQLAGGLELIATSLHVWSTCPDPASWFHYDGTIPVTNGQFTLDVTSDCMYTVTTLSSGGKGVATIPADAPFPLPYATNFAENSEDSIAKYFADQFGSWAVRRWPGTTFNALSQVSPISPSRNGWGGDEPTTTYTYMGDFSASTGIQISASVNANVTTPDQYAAICGRMDSAGSAAKGICLAINGTHWWLSARRSSTLLAQGVLPKVDPNQNFNFRLLSLTLVNLNVTATAEGVVLYSGVTSFFPAGSFAALACEYNYCGFTNFSVVPAS